MGNINVLDCTLRDGGYINNFEFGFEAEKAIVKALRNAKIDIIECGFLKSGTYDENRTIFPSVSDVGKILPADKGNALYVAMIAYGDISADEIEPCDGTSITGIRLTFHEQDIDDAFSFAEKLSEKGYKVFIQPVGTVTYTDTALLSLIDRVNRMKPYAFYLVDTLGNVYKKDLLRMFYLVDNNLNKDIKLGFHTHNNLQLSFSNAQELMEMSSMREVIIDSSVYGMGRGAGNLCTELLIQYINENVKNKYDLLPVLEILDDYIIGIYAHFSWGYSAPYCLAAINKCHPNYATFLMSKQTLRVKDINAIIHNIPAENRHLYDKDLIQQLYHEYQQNSVDDSAAIEKIRELCSGRNVLVLAPGGTMKTHENEIKSYIEANNPVLFAINHIPVSYNYDRIFLSNLKRFGTLNEAAEKIKDKLIITSNISACDNCDTINYSDYLIDESCISDNGGLMLLNILKKSGVRSVSLAGYDGFKDDEIRKYFENKMINESDYKRQTQMNKAMSAYFSELKKSMDITFITPTVYDSEINNEEV